MAQGHSTTHGKWSEEGIPHKGWKCVDFHDLETPSQLCEMCKKSEIRYVHVMAHDNYPEKLEVGVVCAEHMENDYFNPKEREKKLINISMRRKKWLTRKWQTSKHGEPYLRTNDGFIISIFKKYGKWTGSVIKKLLDEKRYIEKSYTTIDEAKLAAFEKMIEWD